MTPHDTLRALVELAKQATPYYRAGELVVEMKASLPALETLLNQEPVAVDRWPHIQERLRIAVEHGDKHGWATAKNELREIIDSDYSSPASESLLGERSYWLIEWIQQPAPLTHLHPEAEWLSRGVHNWTIESVRVEKWTKDTREAIRFPSKEDAEAVIGWLWGRETSIYAATEHMDV